MKTLGLIVILVVLLGGWYWYSQNQNQMPAPSTVDTSTTAGNANTTGSQTGGTTSGSASSGTATPGNPVSDGSGHMLYTVTYNNGIFTPAVLTINHGDAVKWVNKDNLTMRVSAIPQTANPTPITDPNTESKGKTYTLTFTQVGTWNIKNLNDTAVGPGASTVYVK